MKRSGETRLMNDVEAQCEFEKENELHITRQSPMSFKCSQIPPCVSSFYPSSAQGSSSVIRDLFQTGQAAEEQMFPTNK